MNLLEFSWNRVLDLQELGNNAIAFGNKAQHRFFAGIIT
jgi:hypothetical protein